MSYDRVLPNPASLRYESAPVSTLPRPSNLLDHKIMNDRLPKACMALPHRPTSGPIPGADVGRYPDIRSSGVSQTHQHRASYGRVNGALKHDPSASPVQQHVKSGPMISTKGLESDRSTSSSGSSSPAKSAQNENVQFCLCQPDPKIPRPRNAFILYRQHYQSIVVAHNPGMANPEISKVIGEQWRQLSEQEKSKWKALAEVGLARNAPMYAVRALFPHAHHILQEEKIRHAQQYPAYRYQPRRVGRDGSSRSSGSGISHNPTGGSTCNRCGGRIMNAPSSPMTPFTPVAGQSHRGSLSGNISSHLHTATTSVMTASSSQCREKPERGPPKPIRIDQIERPRHRIMGEEDMSPDIKRRRLSHNTLKPPTHAHRDRSPESPYPLTPYSASANSNQPRGMPPMLHPHRPYGSAPSQAQPVPDPSLKLPPLQTAIPSTSLPPFSSTDSSVEAAVMTIPFLNKIKLLAKISPTLVPSFREIQSRGPVIAVDGQDPELVQTAVEYLERLLQKEDKFSVRVFEGPEVHAPRPSDVGPMGDATVDYLNTISAWHRISDEIISFVKSGSSRTSLGGETPTKTNPDAMDTDTSTDGSASPKTIIPKTAALQIHSPESSVGSDASIATPSTTVSTLAHSLPSTPIALVPRYQLTTADAFACSVPINDSAREEVERVGAVEVRLADASTVVLRKAGGGAVEEKALKRMGFEIEDFLTQ
ncbi:uncharacterized protein N7482_007854 [Penicillium canariense]|uniref:HMG box domain-containing protein n=1 Tax=Penicillium canariense TaxID=189055 RepID=A0A9W9LK84_9EURO|nr:uncharacterized protein N7482_007854 [Penicillium canariense]KAJ5160850.1 hypothetical protein N7482_007854 [Penicillium canariense]